MSTKKGNAEKKISLWRGITFIAILVGLLIPSIGLASDYPTKPIQMVVGYSAGGPTSLAARLVAEEVSKELGVPVVVLNKPGASGTIAGSFVARSKPDGYTLLVATSGNLSASFALLPKVPFDLSDFAPIVQHIAVPISFSVLADTPWKTVKDFIEDAKKNPGKYKAGSDGGSVSLTLQALLDSANVDVANMICKGGVPNLTALLAREVQLSTIALTPILPHMEAGKVRVLATTCKSKFTPGVPTIAETGYTDASREFWNGFLAPAGTPQAIIEKLSQVFKKVINTPSMSAKLEKMGLIPTYRGPKEFGAFLQKEKASWIELGKKYKIYK